MVSEVNQTFLGAAGIFVWFGLDSFVYFNYYFFWQGFFNVFSEKNSLYCVILPFILNLIFNLLFTPVQFGLKNNFLALVDILLVLFTLVWLMISIYPYEKLLAFIQLPYFFWVLFATVLQLAITYLNK